MGRAWKRSHLGKLALYPLSQYSQAVSRTHSPDGCQQNKGQEVHDMRQTGLFCLGGEGRGTGDDKEVTEKTRNECRK